MTELLPSPRRGPSRQAVAASALAVALASGLIGAGGWSGLSQLKQGTHGLLTAAATRSQAMLRQGRQAGLLPRGSLAATTPAQPFQLQAANRRERERATRCLANAVYYEAATEPEEGQRAVAQVVLNRVRDPNFPKSICGVVYQGWERQTGCQFSFTCDGSLLRGAPSAALMANARRVASEALAGHVEPQVGTATHYHADYVSPWWRTSVTQVAQIGAHIFYRWPGAAGALANFTARYRGGETRLSEAVLTGRAPRPTDLLTTDDPTVLALSKIVIADASAPGGVRTRVRATLLFSPGAFAAAAPTAVAPVEQRVASAPERSGPATMSGPVTVPAPTRPAEKIAVAPAPAAAPAPATRIEPVASAEPAAKPGVPVAGG